MIEQSRRQVGQPPTAARSGWYRLVEAGLFALALVLGQIFAQVAFVLLRVEPRRRSPRPRPPSSPRFGTRPRWRSS